MANKRVKAVFAAAEKKQAEKDAKVNAKLVELADGTGRLQKYLKDHPEDRRAMERHRQRGIAKGEPGW